MARAFHLLAAIACAAALHATAADPRADKLRATHAELATALRDNDFGRPIHLRSSDASSRLQGDVHAELDYPFAAVREAMDSPAAWCDILVLPFNVKGCQPRDDGLTLYVGRRSDTPLGDAQRIDFRFKLEARGDEIFEARLEAPAGPVGTHDYRIRFEAVPLDQKRTFVHLSYGYGYGTLSKLAMQTYLSTSGASKVGFSKDEGGALVGGMRGVLERNTMRYFLAIDAFLNALPAPQDARAARRIERWFRETERYPRQLHEMTRDEYVAMKRRDVEPPASRLAAR